MYRLYFYLSVKKNFFFFLIKIFFTFEYSSYTYDNLLLLPVVNPNIGLRLFAILPCYTTFSHFFYTNYIIHRSIMSHIFQLLSSPIVFFSFHTSFQAAHHISYYCTCPPFIHPLISSFHLL